MLKVYNTLSRDKQVFTPIQANQVRIYVCGMTVYDYCHLGHARAMIVFDMITRWLRASDYKVTYVRNITDVDDKIIQRANENGESIEALTQRFIEAMNEDATRLGVVRPDVEPRATAHINHMVEMIAKLIKKGHAYLAENGDVFFSVRSFDGYGKLSGKSIDDLRAGERVEVDAFKKNPMDFVLWKSAKSNEPHWHSPWGAGRPGWHIECSVMSAQYLGQRFDIHGGGQDLQFPHHENEIAQSEAGHGCQMANYWLHNGFVRVDDEKMSKSLGNFFTIREVLKQYDAEVVRFFILRAHYRSPLNYSDNNLDDAKVALTRLYTALRGAEVVLMDVDWHHPQAKRFKAAMDDDFNTPEAIAVLFDLAKEKTPKSLALLKSLSAIIGLLEREPDAFLQGDYIDNNTKAAEEKSQRISIERLDIDALIHTRLAAKKAKDYAEADRIRKKLADAGIALEDTAQGTTWRRS